MQRNGVGEKHVRLSSRQSWVFGCGLLYLHDCMIGRAVNDMEPMICSIYPLLTLNRSVFL